jgi:uroporphyrinogen-III decarboxylase
MNEHWERFEAVLKGRIPDRVPLTHTWGLHHAHAAKLLDRTPATDADRLEYLNRMGMHQGLRAYYGHPFGGAKATASDGSEHYVQGGLPPGASLSGYPLPEVSRLVEQFRLVAEASHAWGAAAEGVVTSCIHALSTAMGLEGLAVACYEQPDWLEEAMELVERRNRLAVTAMIEAGFDIVLFDGDCAFKQGLMISPEMMRRFWFDRTRQTVDLLHQADVWAYYHTDGKVDQVLGMLIELGFAAFHGCEKAANDLAYLKATFGRSITLIGNADNAELTFHTPGQIEAETEQMVRTAAPGGRYVADVNTLVPDCAVANYEAFVDTVRRVGVYLPDGTLAGG